MKAIHYYKEASSFNDNFAKNNLGIIYLKGFGDEIAPNIGLSIEYFEEAIRQKDDSVAMYNRSNIYMFIQSNNDNLNKSIDLLTKSFILGFKASIFLLCLVLVKKCSVENESIINEIKSIK